MQVPTGQPGEEVRREAVHEVGGGDGLPATQAEGYLIRPQEVGNRGTIGLVYRTWGRGEVRPPETQEREDPGVEDGYV